MIANGVMERHMLHSPLNYTGGKERILPFLLDLFPKDIDCFYDMFCGGLNVSLNVESKSVVANDINTRLMGIFRAVAEYDDFESLNERIHVIIRANRLHSDDGVASLIDGVDVNQRTVSAEGYASLRDSYNTTGDPVELLVLLFYSFSNQMRFNREFKFNMPIGKSCYNFKNMMELREVHRTIRERGFRFTSGSFTDFDVSQFNKGDFVYCDPPYLITTATYNESNNDESGWNDDDERRLYAFLDSVNDAGVKFGLSNAVQTNGRTNKILNDWMGKYSVFHPDIRYSNANYHRKNKDGDTTVEVYVTNDMSAVDNRLKQIVLF